jgi:hypothetical protein
LIISNPIFIWTSSYLWHYCCIHYNLQIQPILENWDWVSKLLARFKLLLEIYCNTSNVWKSDYVSVQQNIYQHSYRYSCVLDTCQYHVSTVHLKTAHFSLILVCICVSSHMHPLKNRNHSCQTFSILTRVKIEKFIRKLSRW